MDSPCEISKRIKGFFKRLAIHYRGKNNFEALMVLEQGRVFIKEQISYDNWNGGTTGHSLTIYLNDSVFTKIGDLKKQKEIAELLKKDLNRLMESALPNEFAELVSIDLFEADNPDCKQAIDLLGTKPEIEPGDIWKPGYIRLFISHRDKYKRQVADIASELEKYGVSCFVAHDAIEPLSEWQVEIEKALHTMDVLLVFLTDDFHESFWTDQEVGVAVGRSIPVIPLKVQNTNPYGLISKIQALKGNIEGTGVASAVFERLVNSLPQSEKVRRGVVEAFVNAKNFDESGFIVRELLPKVKKMDVVDLERIQKGFSSNSQLFGCYVVNNKLPPFLSSVFKEPFVIKDRKILKASDIVEEEFPF